MKFIRYWGAKPNHVFSDLIHRYSKPKDVILDPFGGKGTAVIEGLKQHRRVIYNDLNPLAYFIVSTLLNLKDIEGFKEATELIRKDLSRYQKIYEIRCKCGRTKKIRYLAWTLLYEKSSSRKLRSLGAGKLNELSIRIFKSVKNKRFTHMQLISFLSKSSAFNGIRPNVISLAINSILVKNGLFRIVGEKPTKVLYDSKCKCGRKGMMLNRSALRAFQPRGKKILARGFPRDKLKYKNGDFFFKRRSVSRLDELFSPRNLFALQKIREKINIVRTSKAIKDALKLCFASILFASSKMQRDRGGAWPIGCYWIPPTFVERNVFDLFYSKCKRLASWKRAEQEMLSVKIGNIRQVLNGDAVVAFLNYDATEIPLKQNSIDYIIVDPPQTDEIQYFELSFLASRWLGFDLPFKSEIVVNPRQGKDEEKYWEMIKVALQKFAKVLKPKGRITVLLHGENGAYFEKFNQILQNLNLKPIFNTFNEYEFTNGLHRFDVNRLNGDYYLTLQKIK
jgi:hypothetical protein